MAVNSTTTVAAIALFCPKCGKLNLHNISRFTIKNAQREFYCTCGNLQARIISISRWQYLFEAPCFVCEKKHLISLDKKKLWQPGAFKIYCNFSNMELGLAGNRQTIESIVNSQHEAASKLLKEIPLSGSPNSNELLETEVENPSIMLEILNKIHDIAEKGELYCCCDSSEFRINLLENSIEIICTKCERVRIIPANCEADRSYIEKLASIEIMPITKGIKNI